MREILFRGKRVDNKEWATSPYHYGTMASGTIIHDFDRETVGQYTGITDKNGTKIFEGDIVKWKDELHEIVYLPKYTRFVARKPHVVFEIITLELSEVVGNIHDNPELLKTERNTEEVRKNNKGGK